MNLSKEEIQRGKDLLDLLPVGHDVWILQDQYKKGGTALDKLVIPRSAREGGSLECYEGVIIAIGQSVPDMFSEGDVVMFGKNSFSSIRRPPNVPLDETQEYIVCKWTDIYAFVDPDRKKKQELTLKREKAEKADKEKKELIKNINKEEKFRSEEKGDSN